MTLLVDTLVQSFIIEIDTTVTEMFHHDLRYLVPQEIEDCDGVGIYVKIMEHLNGQRGRDVDVAK